MGTKVNMTRYRIVETWESMKKPASWVLCWIVMVHVYHTAAALQLHVSPAYIQVGLTEMMTVNCTFDARSTNHLVSLHISKDEDVGEGVYIYHELASVNFFHPDLINVISHINATSSGHFSNNEISFLSLRWIYPTVNEAGTYKCTAHGLDLEGDPVDISTTVQVTTQTPNVDQVTVVTTSLEGDIQDLHKLWQVIENNINKMMISLDTLASGVDSLQVMANNLTELARESKNRVLKLENYAASEMKYQRANYNQSEEYNGKYYFLSSTRNTQANISQALCILAGGYLVEIDDAGENDFVKRFVDMALTVYSSWVLIGGTDAAHEEEWVWWHSQRPINYNDWKSPIRFQSEDYNCLFLYKQFNWRWDDQSCRLNTPFICEILVESGGS